MKINKLVFCIFTLLFLASVKEVSYAKNPFLKKKKTENQFEKKKQIFYIDSLIEATDHILNTLKKSEKRFKSGEDEKVKIEGYFNIDEMPLKITITSESEYFNRYDTVYYNNQDLVYSARYITYFSDNPTEHLTGWEKREQHIQYFWNRTMIRWIEKIDTDVSSLEDDYSFEEQDVLNSIEDYLQILMNPVN